MKEKKAIYKKQYLNSAYNIEKGNLANAIFAIKGFFKANKTFMKENGLFNTVHKG